MKSSKNSYISIFKILLCIFVLMYHLEIIKGGFLAVCCFFVLHGFLDYYSAFKNGNFSIKSYYYKKFIRLYLPLLIVVFLSLAFVSLYNVSWINLKRETFSVIFGYNNFWQIKTNLDYFTKESISPFIHIWYISILMQFDLIFPFLYKILLYIKEKLSQKFMCIFSGLITLIFIVIFGCVSFNNSIDLIYYSTFYRIFSLLIGVTYGIFFTESLTFNVNKMIIKYLIYFISIVLLIISFIFVPFYFKYYGLVMILVSFISCLAIKGAFLLGTFKCDFIDYCSKLIYFIYLIQLPIIYLFRQNDFNFIFLIILLVIVISIFLNYLFDFENCGVFFNIIRVLIGLICVYGFYVFLITPDYTDTMNKLKEQMSQNEKLMLDKQLEYKENIEQETKEWNNIINDISSKKESLEDYVKSSKITGLGDSVMLGAVNTLYSTFTNAYFDAGVSRTCYVAIDALNPLEKKNLVGDIIVLNYGANGDCSDKVKRNILNKYPDKQYFWITVTNDEAVHVNSKLYDLSKEYNNLHIIDWNTISSGHSEYFIKDGLHLTNEGKIAFTNAIYESIYNFYLSLYEEYENKIKNEHFEKENQKFTFIGNDLLLNIASKLQEDYPTSQYEIVDFNNITTLSLNKNIVLLYDKSSGITYKNYLSLINKLNDKKIYLVVLDKKVYNDLKNLPSNVKTINFYKVINDHKEYLLPDKIHLTEKGNLKLIESLLSAIKNK